MVQGESEISQHLVHGLAQKTGRDIHGSQRMNKSNLCDPLTLPLPPLCGSHLCFIFEVLSEMS